MLNYPIRGVFQRKGLGKNRYLEVVRHHIGDGSSRAIWVGLYHHWGF